MAEKRVVVAVATTTKVAAVVAAKTDDADVVSAKKDAVGAGATNVPVRRKSILQISVKGGAHAL